MADWIPNGDLPAAQFMLTNANYVVAHAATLGVPTARAAAYLDAAGAFQDARNSHADAVDAAHAAYELKAQARQDAVGLAREIAGIVQGNPAVTPEQRAAGGWPVHATTKSPIPAPSETPVLTVDTSRRLQHVIRFGFGEGRGRAKPAGVSGYGVWVKIGGETPPTDITGCTFVAISSKGTLTTTYPGGEGGKTAWYIAACLNAKGERGPLSETVAATIAA